MSEVPQNEPVAADPVTEKPTEDSSPVTENAHDSTNETPAASQPEAQPAVEPVKDVHSETPQQTEVAPEQSNSQPAEKPAEPPATEAEKPVAETATEPAPASPKKDEPATSGWQHGSPQKALTESGSNTIHTEGAPAASPRKTEDASPKKACIGDHHDDEPKPVETHVHHEPHEPEKEVRGILVHPGERKNKNTAGVHMAFEEPKRDGPPSANKAKFAERKIEGKEGLVAKKKAQEGVILRRRLDSDPVEPPSPAAAPVAAIEPLNSPHAASSGEHKKDKADKDKADKEKKKLDNKKKGSLIIKNKDHDKEEKEKLKEAKEVKKAQEKEEKEKAKEAKQLEKEAAKQDKKDKEAKDKKDKEDKDKDKDSSKKDKKDKEDKDKDKDSSKKNNKDEKGGDDIKESK